MGHGGLLGALDAGQWCLSSWWLVGDRPVGAGQETLTLAWNLWLGAAAGRVKVSCFTEKLRPGESRCDRPSPHFLFQPRPPPRPARLPG